MRAFEYSLRLTFRREDSFFGPGVVQLMEYIRQTKSINNAAKKMGMSYNKAWRILKRAEEEFGFPLVEKSVGGVNGGGSDITESGQKLIENYLTFQERMYQEADKHFEELFGKNFTKGDQDERDI